MEAMPPFHQWLKRRRQAQGLTQDALAEQVACATQTIRKLEGGQRRPSFQMAQRLAHVLAVPTTELDQWMLAARDDVKDDAEIETERQSSRSISPLPHYFTPFVGRTEECVVVQQLLYSNHSRLVTLLGAGGIGKTRLALEVARQSTDFADGVVFVALAPIATPAGLVAAISDAVGLTFAPSATIDPIAQLLTHLRDRRLLLVLDNFEHLLDTDGTNLRLLDCILQTASHVQLLVTSRERLKLASEWVVEVGGLAVPPHAAVKRISDYAAVTLFVEHARRIQHTFHFDASNQSAIVAICQLLDGMPLGIELTAALVRVLSPAEIHTELTRALDVPPVVAAGIPQRHQSLRAVVEHSWQLLRDTERDVLARLAVFRGGFTRESASEVAGATLLILATLTDKSLIRRAADGRYVMHEIIRQYAETHLHMHPDDSHSTNTRHADYYTRWLASRERSFLGAQQKPIEAEIVGEIDNIRAAWRWASEHHMVEALSRASEILQWFYEFHCWYQEGVTSFEEAINALDSYVDAQHVQRDILLGKLLGQYTYLAGRIGLMTASRAAAHRSRMLLEVYDEPAILARTCAYQGMISIGLGEYLQAKDSFENALRLADPNDHWIIAFVETWYALLLHELGDYVEAEQRFRKGLSLYRLMGNPRGTLWCISFGSVTLFPSGKFQEAEVLVRESFLRASSDHDDFGMAISLQHLGMIALAQQQIEQATYLFREALAIMRKSGSYWELFQTLNQYALALWLHGDVEESAKIYHQSFDIAFQYQALPNLMNAVVGIALYQHFIGAAEVAFKLVTYALANPSSRAETRELASDLRAQLLVELTSEQISVIEARIADLSLEQLIQQIDRSKILT